MSSKISGLDKRLRDTRKKLRLSQKEAAARMGISASSLSSYEGGDSPSLHVFQKIVGVYQVSADELLGTVRRKTINVTGLNERQCKIVQDMVNEFLKCNNK